MELRSSTGLASHRRTSTAAFVSKIIAPRTTSKCITVSHAHSSGKTSPFASRAGFCSPSNRNALHSYPALPLSNHTRPAAAAVDAETEQASTSTSDEFDWADHWYPIAYIHDLKTKQPNTFTLLNQPLVIWLEPISQQWRVFKDACPHRLVPLSEGRINELGHLECPYHGWMFNGEASCVSIPQGGNPADVRTCATAFPCAVKQGLLWVKPKALPPAATHPAPPVSTDDIPILPELDDPTFTRSVDMHRIFPYDYATLLENLLDVGHVPFTHHATISNRSTGSGEYDLKVLKRGPWGFTGVWEKGPRMGTLGKQDSLFQAPSLMRHTIDALDTRGFVNVTAVYAVPISPGRCLAIIRQPFKFKNKVISTLFKLPPRVFGHLGNNTVLEDDVIFLHRQEEVAVGKGLGEKPIGQVYHMPGASDAYVTAFRNWLGKSGGGGPFGAMNALWLQATGPRLQREDLLERYHSHTENCAICSGALRNVRMARGVLRVLGSLSLFVATISLAVGVSMSAALSDAAQAVTASSAAVPGSAPAAAAGGAAQGLRGFGQTASIAIVQLVTLLAGDAASSLSTALTLFLAAGVCGALYSVLGGFEARFMTGTWPPPRNYKK